MRAVAAYLIIGLLWGTTMVSLAIVSPRHPDHGTALEGLRRPHLLIAGMILGGLIWPLGVGATIGLAVVALANRNSGTGPGAHP